MDKNCNIIQDLLPLYQDNICSEESKKMVEEHLRNCEACKAMSERLSSSEVEEKLSDEKNGILGRHAKREKRRTTMVGMVTAGVLLIPVIVCLICNLATGRALDWFFIVLASLLVFASLSVVPLLKEKNRLMWTVGSFTVSLMILLGVICIYTRSDWFALAAVPTLFGLVAGLLPYILYQAGIRGILRNAKGLICMAVDTGFLYLVIWVCGRYAQSADYDRIAYSTTSLCVVIVWLAFLIIRYVRLPALCRAGLVLLEAGLALPIIDHAVDYFIYGEWKSFLSGLNLLNWTSETVDANLNFIIVICFMVTGVCLLIAGVVKLRTKGK